MTGINVVYAIDRGYLRPLTTSILSLIANYSDSRPLTISVFEATLHEGDKAHLLALGNERVKITFVSIEEFLRKRLRGIKCHLGLMTFGRLVVGELLPTDVEKVIYLDADTVIESCISQLWDFSLGGNIIGAVSTDLEHQGKLKHLSQALTYFNGAVLLIDITRWRNAQVLNQCLETMRSYVLPHMTDQDILNIVLGAHCLTLHPRWNCSYTMFKTPSYHGIYTPQQINEAITAPCIIHYMSNEKPWKLYYFKPFQENFLRYDRQTHWNGALVKPPPRCVQWLIKKIGLRPYY